MVQGGQHGNTIPDLVSETIEEGQQLLLVVGDLRGSFRVLGLVSHPAAALPGLGEHLP